MKIVDFDLYKELLKEKSGLTLSSDKSYLLDSRLSPVAKKWGYASLNAMSITLQGVPETKLVDDIVEAMMVGETAFYRDYKPFELLKKKVLPHLLKQRINERKIRIWSAGTSTGQEAYSVALAIKEMESLFAGWKIEILATDLSKNSLSTAKEGLYSQFDVQHGMPTKLLLQNFKQEDESWRISKSIKKMVQFKQFNMLDAMDSMGAFDIILCRNVMVYFDDATKKKILQNLSKTLKKDGFLFLGINEASTSIYKTIHGTYGLFVRSDSDYPEKV